MSTSKKTAAPLIFGREPVMIANAVEGLIACLIAFHALAWAGIDSAAAMMIVMAVVNAAMGVYIAYYTDETELAAVSALFKALVALGALYGFNLTDQQTAAVLSALAVVFALWHRTQAVAVKSAPASIKPPTSRRADVEVVENEAERKHS